MKRSKPKVSINPDTILLDIVSRWPATEAVFRRYDEKADVCLCCTCLFDTIEDIADKYHLDFAGLMREIEDAAAGKSRPWRINHDRVCAVRKEEASFIIVLTLPEKERRYLRMGEEIKPGRQSLENQHGI